MQGTIFIIYSLWPVISLEKNHSLLFSWDLREAYHGHPFSIDLIFKTNWKLLMKWNERIVICFKSHALEIKLYVLFDKMRSQFYKYPLAIKLNIPLMPIFMVLSTHPLGATSNSSPRLQKKRDRQMTACTGTMVSLLWWILVT